MKTGVTIGFDTSTAALSVAASRAGVMAYESFVEADESGRPRHARALIGEIETAVAKAGGWPAILRLGVGIGPGTFTGLRIGVATARALAQARDVPVVPVGSLAALLEPASEVGRPVLGLIDAKRGEVFAALRIPAGGGWGPEVLAPQSLIERLAGVESPLAIGDGSLRFRDELESAGVEVPPSGEALHKVSAAAICRLAESGEAAPLEAIRPDYLRRPDAELWREQQQRERNDRDR